MGDSTGVALGSFDFCGLTERSMIDRGHLAGLAAFADRRRRGMTVGNDLYIESGEIIIVDDEHAFHPDGSTQTDGDGWREYVQNVGPKGGKLATVIEYLLPSVIAFHDHSTDAFFANSGPVTWCGGTIERFAYRRKDGTWLHRIFAAAASGDHGAVDQYCANAVVAERGLLWLMHVKMLDEAGLLP